MILTRILAATVFTFYFAIAGSTVYANADHKPMDLDIYRDLKKSDVFHPPTVGEEKSLAYKEWHYFNMVSEEQNISVSTVLILEGDINDSANSYAIDTIGYTTPVKSDLRLDVYGIDDAEWSATSPDVRVATSFITFDRRGYHLRSETSDGKTVYDVIYTPKVGPDDVYDVPVGADGNMTWLVSSPKMRVDGTLTINKGTDAEKVYVLKNAKGYHDHNWGYWDWADDMGWDWGQVYEEDRSCWRFWLPCKTRAGKYSLAMFNYTNAEDTEARQQVLKMWKHKRKFAEFGTEAVEITNVEMTTLPYLPNNPYPAVNLLTVREGFNVLDVTFTTTSAAPMFLPIEDGFRIIWEMTGQFEVRGIVNGRLVFFKTKGIMEYLGKPLYE